MSSRNRLLALAVLPAVLLAGCGDDDKKADKSTSSSSSSSSTSSGLAAAVTKSSLDDVTVDAKNAAKPNITIPKDKLPFGTADVKTKTLTKGSGKKVGDKDLVNADFAIVNGTNGKTLASSFGQSVGRINMANSGTYLPGLISVLKSTTVGSKVVASIPAAQGFGAAGSPQLGVGGKDDIVVYLDVKDSSEPLKELKSSDDAASDGFPAVKVPAGAIKEATMTFDKNAKAPTSLKQKTIINGTGDTIAKGDTIAVNYTGQIWNGKVFDSSAKHGTDPATFAIGLGKVIPGWDKTLVGKKVGDRVVIVVPPADGYGSKGSSEAGIKGTDTLVFVVDILADYGAQPQQQ